METATPTDNVLNDIVNPQGGGKGEIRPNPEPATGVIGAAARELAKTHEAMNPLNLDAEQRRMMAGQSRVYQAAATEVCGKILAISKRVADKAEMTPASVDNLLLFGTANGAVTQAAWPITAYGLLLTRDTGAQIDNLLDEIDAFGRTPAGRLVGLAMGQALQAEQRNARSAGSKQRQTRARKDQAAAELAQKKARVVAQQGASQMAQAMAHGTVSPPLPAAGTGGKKTKAPALTGKTKGKTTTQPAATGTGKAKGKTKTKTKSKTKTKKPSGTPSLQ